MAVPYFPSFNFYRNFVPQELLKASSEEAYLKLLGIDVKLGALNNISIVRVDRVPGVP